MEKRTVADESIEAGQAFCSIHGEDFLIRSLNITNSGPIFMCIECQDEVEYNIQINDIQDSRNHSVFKKWLIKEKEVVEKIRQQLKPNKLAKDHLEERTTTTLNSLDKDVKVKLDSINQQLIETAQKADKYQVNLTNTYNEATQKQKLQNLFSDLSSGLFKKEEQAREIVQKVQINSEQEQKKIKDMMSEYETQLKTLDPEAIKRFFYKQMIEYLESKIPDIKDSRINDLEAKVKKLEDDLKAEKQLRLKTEEELKLKVLKKND